MSEMKIYGTQGEALYPKNAKNDTNMTSYFDNRILSIGCNDGHFVIEAYLRVETGEHKIQGALRYSEDAGTGNLKHCRRAFRRVLVDQLGWDIREPQRNKPWMVPWSVIWDEDLAISEQYSPRDLYTDSEFGLGLSQNEADILTQLSQEKDHTIQITASGYGEIAKIIPAFADTDQVVVVSRPRHAPPDHADIHFSVAEQQYETFKLHSTTRKTLDEQKEQRRSKQRRESLQELSQTLQLLNELETAEETVRRQLNSALSNTYSGLEVIDSSARHARTNVSNSTTSSTGRKQYSSTTTRARRKRLFVVFLLILVLLISLILGWVFLLNESILGILINLHL